jgi:hypothetical protein
VLFALAGVVGANAVSRFVKGMVGEQFPNVKGLDCVQAGPSSFAVGADCCQVGGLIPIIRSRATASAWSFSAMLTPKSCPAPVDIRPGGCCDEHVDHVLEAPHCARVRGGRHQIRAARG